MAGGKETPRQKMIGMMYLVLTALLALQVSSAIIQKFKFLDDSLMNVNAGSLEENAHVEQGIKKIVAQEGNKPADVAVLNKAEEVRKKTDDILNFMNGLRKELIDVTGGLEEDGNYKGAKEEEKVANLMVGVEGQKNGKGYVLKTKLEDYSAFLAKHGVKVQNGSLALDAKDDPMFKKTDQARKDFAQLNFSETPMVAALAVLAQKEAEVLKYENELLSVLSQEVGASNIKFDHVFAMVRPKSKVVAAGTKYEAEMFIAASSTALKPTMMMGSSNLPVKDNFGQVSFTAQGGGTPDKDGLIKKTWQGSITIKNKGKDTTFKVTEEYFVAQPVLQIQSASVSALYKNCGNELTVNCPALGSTYNPSFQASNAQVINGSKKGDVILVPQAIAPVDLKVSSNGNYIGNQTFKVKVIPKPSVEAWGGSKALNVKSGEVASSLRMINMKAIPEEGFKAFLPKDARYQVSQWTVTLVSGKRPAGSKTFNTPSGDVSSLATLAKPGDRYLIEVKKVTRKNFRDVVEDVAGTDNIMINIPLI